MYRGPVVHGSVHSGALFQALLLSSLASPEQGHHAKLLVGAPRLPRHLLVRVRVRVRVRGGISGVDGSIARH